MSKTINELFEEFIRESRYVKKLSEATIRGYASSFKLLMDLFPSTTFDAISPKLITDFLELLEKRERKVGRGQIKRGIKKSTAATYWSKLNSFMDWLEMKKKIKRNPFRDLKYPDVRYDNIQWLKREDIEKIFTAISFNIHWENNFIKKRNLLMMYMFLCCGLRRSELLAVKLLDIDLTRKQITVRAETSKSRLVRIIPLNHEVITHLNDYLNERQLNRLNSPYLFVSGTDEHFTVHGLKHLVGKLVEASGVKFHVHQLRHTFAVNLLHNGCDIAKLSQLMGHRDIRMTAAYLRVLPTSFMAHDVETLRLDNLY